MIEKMEELFEETLICAIVKGVSLAIAIIFACVAIAMGICAMIYATWWAWLLGFIFSGLIAGASFGFFFYLYDEY